MTLISSLTELLSASGDAAYEWDMRADKIQWFGAWERLFPSDKAPVDSKSFGDAVHADDRAAVFGNEELAIDRKYRVIGEGGRSLWVHERGKAELKDGQVVRQSGLLRLIEKPLEFAFQPDIYDQDLLTGCFNRGHMLTLIAKAMESAKGGMRSAGYMVLGIDKMSFVNEAVGMQAGDALLRGVAERLSRIIPTRAMLARVGGDMFGILLPEPLGSEMGVLAERILQNFRDHPVVTDVTPLHITVSIGGVRMPTVSRIPTEAMIFAEQALHDAHQRGRNLFSEYLDSPERMQINRELLELGERIKRAFKHDGFRLAFQPIVEAATGRVNSYEALVRMFDEKGNAIAAAAFVPAIEQLGLAPELDRRVLEMAVEELVAHPGITLAINVSGLTASQSDWSAHLKRALAGRAEVAQRLIVEITETAAIVDIDETRRFIDALRELGGRASLDDFGAGFTSVRYLRSLSLSFMKIDKDLLHNLLTHAAQQHLVRALIELAKGLGLQVVAEGVETAEVAEWMKKARVDFLQGYYFGKPSFERPWAEKKDISFRALGEPANKNSELPLGATAV